MFSFRVVTYNILADVYSDSDYSRDYLFPHCPADILSIDYRKQLLLKELTGVCIVYKCALLHFAIFTTYLPVHQHLFCKRFVSVNQNLFSALVMLVWCPEDIRLVTWHA